MSVCLCCLSHWMCFRGPPVEERRLLMLNPVPLAVCTPLWHLMTRVHLATHYSNEVE